MFEFDPTTKKLLSYIKIIFYFFKSIILYIGLFIYCISIDIEKYRYKGAFILHSAIIIISQFFVLLADHYKVGITIQQKVKVAIVWKNM